jgi:hypothetical protein
MAIVIRFDSSGSSTVEETGLSFERAKELAARLTEAGEPRGCSWCVGLDEGEEEPGDQRQVLSDELGLRAINSAH